MIEFLGNALGIAFPLGDPGDRLIWFVWPDRPDFPRQRGHLGNYFDLCAGNWI